MKKIRLLLPLLLCGLYSSVMAENVITTNDVVIRPGGTAELVVSLQNDADFQVYAYDFRLYLPEGITVVKDDSYVYALSSRHSGHAVNVQQTTDGAVQFGVSSPEAYLTGTAGPVIGIKLQADKSLDADVTLPASITTITYANKEAQTVHPANVEFSIKTANRVELDENALLVPDATADNVDILVRRALKAGEWSTICLPFAMSVDKLKAAFGDDYRLYYISGCKFKKDGDKVTGINVEFTPRTTALQVNRPYIIKVSKDISEFVVNAKINPTDAYRTEVTEEDPDTGDDVTICSMTGNLKTGTVIPKNSLFLNGNKFYYSTGKTRMDAFRSYFTFNEVLADVINADTRIAMSFEETTGVVPIDNGKWIIDNEADAWYDLQGRKIDNRKSENRQLPKGVYVHDGKKMVIK